MLHDDCVARNTRSLATPRIATGRLARMLAPLVTLLVVGGVCRSSAAANVCNETVAANRTIDGIPSYAQCTASTSSPIYSNNGVDTATTSGGTGWVRTQGSNGYQCTELAHRYLYFKWNVQSVPNGNAGTWCDGTIPTGLVKSTTPVRGDLIVFAPGSCGADATTGHVAVIDVVNTNSTVTFVEQNSPGRRSCANSTAACFLHATANDASSLDAGTPDSAISDSARADATGTGGAQGTGGMTGTGGSMATGGAVGTGGLPGTGGAVGTGGLPGTGGAVLTGGVTGSAGTGGASSTTVVGAGGSAGTTSTAGTVPATTSSNGCACRIADRRHEGPSGWDALIVLVLALGFVSSRRRSSRRKSKP